MRSGTFVTVVALVGLALTGCTMAAPKPVPSPTASASPAPSASPAVEARPTIADGVVGTVILQPGAIALTITHSDGEYFVSGLPDAVPTGWYGLLFARAAAGDDGCFDDENPAMLAGLPWPTTVSVFERDQFSGDPSFLHEAAIFSAPGPTCASPRVASGAITWTIPSQFPGLLAADSGATGGAMGEVTLDAGVPVSYWVVKSDLIEEVAARFNLTVDELQWLNPLRNGKPTLTIDEALNLSQGLR